MFWFDVSNDHGDLASFFWTDIHDDQERIAMYRI